MVSVAKRFIDRQFTDEAFAVIFYLRECVSSARRNVIVSKDVIEYVLYENTKRTREHTNVVGQVIKELEDNEIICKEGHVYVAKAETFASNKHYIMVAEEVFESFLHMTSNRNRWAVFHLYCLYAANFSSWYKYKAGNRPMSFFADLLNVKEVTVARYTKVLEDLKLIYIIRFSFDGAGKPNVYCLYEDKEDVDDLVSLIDNTGTGTKQSNFKRSVVQRYKAFCEKPSSVQDVERLMHDVDVYNRLQAPYVGKRDWVKLLDTSVFNLT